MIKFVESHAFLIQEFVDENGTRYRTTSGNHWEELMGESWETAICEDELRIAYNRFLQRETFTNVIELRAIRKRLDQLNNQPVTSIPQVPIPINPVIGCGCLPGTICKTENCPRKISIYDT